MSIIVDLSAIAERRIAKQIMIAHDKPMMIKLFSDMFEVFDLSVKKMVSEQTISSDIFCVG